MPTAAGYGCLRRRIVSAFSVVCVITSMIGAPALLSPLCAESQNQGALLAGQNSIVTANPAAKQPNDEVVLTGTVRDTSGTPKPNSKVTISYFGLDGKMTWRSSEQLAGANGEFHFLAREMALLPGTRAAVVAAELDQHLIGKQDVTYDVKDGKVTLQPASVSLLVRPFSRWLTLFFILPALAGIVLTVIHLTRLAQGIWNTYLYAMGGALTWIIMVTFLLAAYLRYGFELIPLFFHPALQSMFDPIYPPGLHWYWKADFVNELSDEAIALHVRHGSELPTMWSTMHMYPINGAARRVGNNETAWSYRESTWAEVIVGVDPDPKNKNRIIEWARQYWEALHPYSAGGAYVNFMMEEGDDRIRATYRENYERLAEIKAKYDPTNFFRVNQNIKPGKVA